MKTGNNKLNDSEIKALLKNLGSDNGMVRQKAREEIVKLGRDAIDYLMELLSHPKYIYRWEAVKALKEIAHPDSIPVFLQALNDEKSDVRWIAAEGLIELGLKSVRPLLKTLIEKSDSVFIYSGAHHVFFELKEKGLLPRNFPVKKLLIALKDTEWESGLRPLVYDILDKFETSLK